MTQKAITEAIATAGSGGAADTLVLSANTIELKVGETSTFAVATTSSDTVVVSSEQTNIATATIDGNTVTVTGVRLGYSTIENEPSTTIATVSGKTATNSGNYNLTYTLTDENRYEWSNNTTGAKTFAWSISRATGSLSISATSGNTAVATVRLDGKTVTITGVKTGTATITVSQTEGTNHTAPTSVTYTATIDLFVDNTLNNNSWETISEISQRGTGDVYWDVGDCKQIVLNGKIGNQLTLTNTALCVFILHFNYAMNGTAENKYHLGRI